MQVIKYGNGNEIRYKIKNARVIELYTDSINVVETIDKYSQKIQKLIINNIEISVGEEFKHSHTEIPSSYTIEKIERGADASESYRYKYTIFSHIRNKTTTYILPCLGKSCGYFDVDGYLLNAYLDKGYNKLYLSYRFSQTNFYSNLEKELLKHKNILEISTLPGNIDVYQFSIPEEHREDIRLFMGGKYSQFSDLLKKKIKVFYQLSDKSRLWKILTKDKDLLQSMKESLNVPRGFYWNVDLDSKPNKKDEIWKL